MLHINVTASTRSAFHHVAFFYLCKVTRVTARVGAARCFALFLSFFLRLSLFSLSYTLALSLSLEPAFPAITNAIDDTRITETRAPTLINPLIADTRRLSR